MSKPIVMSARLALQDASSGYRCAVELDSGHRLALDNVSDGEVPTPVETLLASLVGCTAMDVIHILRKKRQDVRRYEVVVTGERREQHPRSFVRIELLHRVEGRDIHPAAVEEAIRLSETTYCSVHASLDRDIQITSRFEIVPV